MIHVKLVVGLTVISCLPDKRHIIQTQSARPWLICYAVSKYKLDNCFFAHCNGSYHLRHESWILHYFIYLTVIGACRLCKHMSTYLEICKY